MTERERETEKVSETKRGSENQGGCGVFLSRTYLGWQVMTSEVARALKGRLVGPPAHHQYETKLQNPTGFILC